VSVRRGAGWRFIDQNSQLDEVTDSNPDGGCTQARGQTSK
jgi:hypothetical protein